MPSSYRDNPDPGFRGSAADYRARLEPAVAATEPAPAPAYRSVEAEAMFSIAISLKRIADSLAQLTSATPTLMSALDINGPAAASAAIKAATAQPPDVNSSTHSARSAGYGGPAEFTGHAPRTDDNPWIDWPSGECPVPDGTRVEVRWNDIHGQRCHQTIIADDVVRFAGRKSASNIQYRVTK